MTNIEVGWEGQKVGSSTMKMTDVTKVAKAEIVALVKQTGRPLALDLILTKCCVMLLTRCTHAFFCRAEFSLER